MEELVYLKNDEAVCSSLQVAEKFGKRHADVMRSIENLVKNDSTQNCVQCFKQSTYKDDTGKSNKMYVMNRDASHFLSWDLLGEKLMNGNGSISKPSIKWKDSLEKSQLKHGLRQGNMGNSLGKPRRIQFRNLSNMPKNREVVMLRCFT